MRNARIYLLQVLGIFVLVCAYFISDQPDRLSVMHFDLSSSNVTVIGKSTRNTNGTSALQVVSSSQDHNDRKTNITKLFTFELIMPSVYIVHYPVSYAVKPIAVLPESYDYLFYKEINPPPPKVC
jgi:hypothetical protein